ncbi:Mov34/MPN/PAD-1 family protein [Acidilobus sp.]|uniref:Mov34/MPN/PAD-1 family protein n=1 Tax=Acidilobus sp. TaxID=1872109 RepID=UPI003CFBCA6B
MRGLVIGRGLAEHLVRLSMGRSEETGLCLGVGNRVLALEPAENVLRSPTEFLANPLDIVAGYAVAENLGVEVVALYHTHPGGLPVPSEKDVEGMRLWPLPWIIASRGGLRAWVLNNNAPEEIAIEII